MAYTLTDLVRLTARRNGVSPALKCYEMDDASSPGIRVSQKRRVLQVCRLPWPRSNDKGLPL